MFTQYRTKVRPAEKIWSDISFTWNRSIFPLTNQVEFYLFQRFNHLSLRRVQLKPIQNGVFQLSYQAFMQPRL